MNACARISAAAIALAVLAGGSAQAQLLPGGGSGGPIDISADQGIEWHQEIRAYVARGNAKAIRGNGTVTADVLTAYYRDTKDKGSEVYRLIAEGNVHVFSPTQQVFGDHGVYDIDQKISVVTGQNLRLLTQTDTVTARDSLEYYEDKKLAVARGNAIAVRNDKQLRADTLLGLFKEDKDGKLVMDRIDGIGSVLITTPTDVARSRRLMYNVDADVAILTGEVKITRGESQINGDAAEMNMKTKVNRVLSAGQRIQGLLVNNQNQNKPAADAAKPPSGSPAPAAASAPATTPPAATNPAATTPPAITPPASRPAATVAPAAPATAPRPPRPALPGPAN